MLSLAEKKLLSSENIPTCAKCTRHSSEKGDSEELVLQARASTAAAWGSPPWTVQDSLQAPGIHPTASTQDSSQGRQRCKRNPKEALCWEKLHRGMSGVVDENREGWDCKARPPLGAFPVVERGGQLVVDGS